MRGVKYDKGRRNEQTSARGSEPETLVSRGRIPPRTEPQGAGRARASGPPFGACSICGVAIDVHDMARGGICDSRRCLLEVVRGRLQERARLEEGRAVLAEDHARTRFVKLSEEEREGATWSVVPVNGSAPVPLSPELRDRFLHRLEGWVGEADGLPESREATEGDDSLRPDDEESAFLAGGCAACRGQCCRLGGDHAFLDGARMARFLADNFELSPDEVITGYREHLPETHLKGGCVYQGVEGCRLPRHMRADLCDRFHCADLVDFRRLWHRRGPSRHLFVSVGPGDSSVAGDRLVERPAPAANRP